MYIGYTRINMITSPVFLSSNLCTFSCQRKKEIRKEEVGGKRDEQAETRAKCDGLRCSASMPKHNFGPG